MTLVSWLGRKEGKRGIKIMCQYNTWNKRYYVYDDWFHDYRKMAESGSDSNGSRRSESMEDGPNTWKANCWKEPISYMVEVKQGIREWNENHWEGDHNPYTQLEIQAYTLIKTSPPYEPWVTFKLAYWRLLVLYVATRTYQDDGNTMENIINLIRWRGTPEEVEREVEITKEKWALGEIPMGLGAQYWRDMYARLEQRKMDRNVPYVSPLHHYLSVVFLIVGPTGLGPTGPGALVMRLQGVLGVVHQWGIFLGHKWPWLYS